MVLKRDQSQAGWLGKPNGHPPFSCFGGSESHFGVGVSLSGEDGANSTNDEPPTCPTPRPSDNATGSSEPALKLDGCFSIFGILWREKIRFAPDDRWFINDYGEVDVVHPQ